MLIRKTITTPFADLYMLITLTSDIGWQDYLVGAAKGRILQAIPGAGIADVSHQLTPFNYPQAAYVCQNAFKNFPDFTYHIVLVNLFETKPKQLLLAFHNNQYLLCADNGLLTMITETRPELVIGLPFQLGRVIDTLHCIDVFAAAIAALAAGNKLETIGEPDTAFTEKTPIKPSVGPDWMEAHVIFIDHFENVVLDVTRDNFDEVRKGRNFRIEFRNKQFINQLSQTYADAAHGDALALFNAAGYLEISINKGNAAGLLGLNSFVEQASNSYLQNRLFYNTVKIFFY